MDRGRETENVSAVGELGDVLVVRFLRERDTIIAFVVQYEARIDGRRYPMIRCDTAHGFAHWEILDWRGKIMTKAAVTVPMPYNAVMRAAINHLKTNWKAELEAFMRRMS
jgi:hypothetical protein